MKTFDPETRDTFARLLRAARLRSRLTQRGLAEKIDVTLERFATGSSRRLRRWISSSCPLRRLWMPSSEEQSATLQGDAKFVLGAHGRITILAMSEVDAEQRIAKALLLRL
jgi:hypothetical protein